MPTMTPAIMFMPMSMIMSQPNELSYTIAGSSVIGLIASMVSGLLLFRYSCTGFGGLGLGLSLGRLGLGWRVGFGFRRGAEGEEAGWHVGFPFQVNGRFGLCIEEGERKARMVNVVFFGGLDGHPRVYNIRLLLRLR